MLLKIVLIHRISEILLHFIKECNFFLQRHTDSKWNESLDTAKELILNFITLLVTGNLSPKRYISINSFMNLTFYL